MRSTTRFLGHSLLLAVVFALVIASIGAVQSSAQEYSHARIVRLSFVEGTVTVQRPDMDDWSNAPVNTPIQDGFKLSTGADSFAEVEFENANSTARFGERSLVEFAQLALAPDGGKVNRLVLDQGYATFHFDPADNDVYDVKAGDTTLTPYGNTEFRIDLASGQTRVEVFKGSLEVAGPDGTKTLAKNTVTELRPGEASETAEGITKDDWDQWVEERDQLEAAAQAPAGAPSYTTEVGSSFYGTSDLNGYGDWGYLPGYGNVWFPDVGFGWAPYSFGRWCWYPGFGYTWISAEPWGWLPFHYGGWLFDPTFGWFWTPFGFNAWSPGLVTWYQGPGWVGWAPKPVMPTAKPTTPIGGTGKTTGAVPNTAGFRNNYCPNSRTCMVVVSANALGKGLAVTSDDLKAVDLAGARGRLVPHPEVPPTRLASLPGAPVQQAAAFLGRRPNAGAAGVNAASPHTFAARAPSSTGLPPVERASSGFFGETHGPASSRSEHSVWGGGGGGHSGHFGSSSHAAPKASSESSGGGSRSGGGHASSAGSFGGGGGGFSGGGGGGGGHSSGGGGGGGGGGHSHH